MSLAQESTEAEEKTEQEVKSHPEPGLIARFCLGREHLSSEELLNLKTHVAQCEHCKGQIQSLTARVKFYACSNHEDCGGYLD